MRRKTFSILSLGILAVTVFVTSAWAVTLKVLHRFNVNDGANPTGLVFDASGNLYGTTYYGGGESCYDGIGHGCGTVFELTPKAGGGWSEKVLHYFRNNHQDGNYPSDGVIFDASGNLYGTTARGGAYNEGTVFELTPKADGAWTEKVLYSFNSKPKDGYRPSAGLIFDASGNLYGTTWFGGETTGCHDGLGSGCGTVFELTPNAGGSWTETILHRFRADGSQGISPGGSLIFDASGNLYGTTSEGGAGGFGAGTTFELIRNTHGAWTEKTLHTFSRHNRNDGNNPSGSLIFDASGNLYGTTSSGGRHLCTYSQGCGTVFELTPKADGVWTEKILHYFGATGKDGNSPDSSLIFDAAGNLYGTTALGGPSSGGTVFELIPKSGGSWTEKILHTFNYPSKDGFAPGALIFDASGNFYGTTFLGGTGNCLIDGEGGCGTVFKIIP